MNHGNNTGNNNGRGESAPPCRAVSEADGRADAPALNLRNPGVSGGLPGAAAACPGGPRGAAVVSAIVDYFKGQRDRSRRGPKRTYHSTDIARPEGGCTATHARRGGMTPADRVGICRQGRASAVAATVPLLPWLDRTVAGRFAANPENETPATPQAAARQARYHVRRHAGRFETH
jgi:hypothetical protein